MNSRVMRIFKIHLYLRRFVDGCLAPLLVFWLRRKGLETAPRISFAGLPIITLAPGSRIVIGEGCRLVSRALQTALGVNHPIILRTLNRGAEIRLGRGIRASGLTVCAARRVIVGDRCVIGANVTIVDTDFHSLDPAVRSSVQDAASAEHRPVEIGADVFIGAGTYILKGVTVEPEAVIGCGSIVTHDVPRRAIVAGNPAVLKGTVQPKEPQRPLEAEPVFPALIR
jgi:carbonic anhydrase/acetyltransferase-like protein (isoleucine patch superfamily)